MEKMVLSSLLLLLLPQAWSSSDVRVEIPNYAIRSSSVQMKCTYKRSMDSIHTLIWYKDGQQFFRYVSSETPRISFKNQPFFQFEIYSFEKGELHLRNLSLEASGHYKCEITERTIPASKSSSAQAMLTVIDLPEDAAKIKVSNNSYRIGEEITANCSTLVKQSVVLTHRWKINDQVPGMTTKNVIKLIEYPVKELNGTEIYSQGIQFIADKKSFNSGILKLECEAMIPGIFQKSTVASIKEIISQTLPRTSRARRELGLTVIIPPYKERSSTAELKCLYSLQGNSLYSVKWYKGSKQFYQYIPGKPQPKLIFPIPHLQVDINASNEGHVILRNLSMDATGQYKCEVITEAPHFLTKFGNGSMVVIDLPESAPVLSNLRNSYQLGEEVHINCSSLSSNPAASLQWQINDKIVNNSHWLIPYPIIFDPNNLETAILGLQFIATRDHFLGGTMRLKCKAQIGNLYYQSQESVVLHTNFLERKQESHGYYVPSFFYNSSSTSKRCSDILLAFLSLISIHNLLR